MKRLLVLTFMAIFIGVLSMSCTKEKTIAGPTEYDTTETVVYDTIVDTVISAADALTKFHAYVVSQAYLDSELLIWLEGEYGIEITWWMGNYSSVWYAQEISQTDNTFELAGICTPLLTVAGDTEVYFEVIEYAGLVLTYTDGDPFNPDSWTASLAASTPVFNARGMFGR